MPGPRVALTSRRITRIDAPISSAITPKLLIRAMTLTPSMFTTVPNTTRIAPSSSAFWAPPFVTYVPASAFEPTNWKNVETCGRTTCHATATAATVTIEPTM